MELLLENFMKRENVVSQRHNGLILFNYSKECQYKRDWDAITLNSRGIVFEEATGKIVARPFSKFFCLGEPECLIVNLPTGQFLSLTKVDGSMGIVYFYQGEWHVNTRGSFSSDQAIWAKKWFDANIDTSWMFPLFTYCFEIVYPDNRIVIDYGGQSFMCLLGVIDNETGTEMPYQDMRKVGQKMGCPVVEAHEFNSMEELFAAQKNLSANEEGFVITYLESGLKFKLKGDAYTKIHRMISNLTPLAFWRSIDWEDTLEIPIEYVAGLPEEFRKTVDTLKEITERLHKEKMGELISLVETVPGRYSMPGKTLSPSDRKDRYEYIMRTFGPLMGSSVLLFLDGRLDKIKKAIHDDVRPTGNRFEGVDVDYRITNLLNDEE